MSVHLPNARARLAACTTYYLLQKFASRRLSTHKSRLPARHDVPACSLTCTDENFITKAGAQKYAAENGVALVCPDTSPRGAGIAGETDSWDFGAGAGFYLNATEDKWAGHYRMYDYITQELPRVLAATVPQLDVSRVSIMGHSMGGLGALVIGLRNAANYKSISAFAPICHPSACPWGNKAFSGYLGTDKSAWAAYDPTDIVKALPSPAPGSEILIDQGSADDFLAQGQLLPDDFLAAAGAAGVTVRYRLQDGYDHSYYFIATFIADHIAFHASHLKPKP